MKWIFLSTIIFAFGLIYGYCNYGVSKTKHGLAVAAVGDYSSSSKSEIGIASRLAAKELVMVEAPSKQKYDLNDAALLTNERLDSVLAYISSGSSIAQSSEAQNFLKAFSRSPEVGLNVVISKLDAISPNQISERANVFGLLIEVSKAVHDFNPENMDSYLQQVSKPIFQQVSSPKLIEISLPETAKIEDMIHQGPYSYIDGKLYAQTFQPGFMAIAVLKEADTPATNQYFSEIAGDQNVDPKLRQLAGHYAVAR